MSSSSETGSAALDTSAFEEVGGGRPSRLTASGRCCVSPVICWPGCSPLRMESIVAPRIRASASPMIFPTTVPSGSMKKVSGIPNTP